MSEKNAAQVRKEYRKIVDQAVKEYDKTEAQAGTGEMSGDPDALAWEELFASVNQAKREYLIKKEAAAEERRVRVYKAWQILEEKIGSLAEYKKNAAQAREAENENIYQDVWNTEEPCPFCGANKGEPHGEHKFV